MSKRYSKPARILRAVFVAGAKLPASVLRFVILGYQYLLSPFLLQTCRFYPRCSSYCSEALKRHGLRLGFYLALKRIVRCHPWNPGGYDPLPESGPNPGRRGAPNEELKITRRKEDTK